MKKLFSFFLCLCLMASTIPLFSARAQATLELCYDDYYTFKGTTSVTCSNSDIVEISGNTLHAVGISSTPITVTADGISYAVTVKKAKINIAMVCGQSNAAGEITGTPSTADVYKSTTIPKGRAYLWGAGATAPTSFTGGGGSNRDGFRAALAAEWYEQSALNGDPQKTVIVYATNHTATPGETIEQYLSSDSTSARLDKSAAMLNACYDYYFSGAGSAFYDIVGCGMYWLQGESDSDKSVTYYYENFSTLWKNIKTATSGRLQYCGFMRVRKSRGFNNLGYSGAVIAQYQLANDFTDIFTASNLTENWSSTSGDTLCEVDISNYHIFGEAQYSSIVSGNTLTEKLSHLYGGLHYSRLGYNLIGADAAYNMYRSLYKPQNNITLSLADGKTSTTVNLSSSITLTEDFLTDNALIYAAPGSASTTVTVTAASTGFGGKDITNLAVNSMAASSTTGCLINKENLATFVDPTLTVAALNTATTFIIDTATTENPDDFGSSPSDAVYYHWDLKNSETYAKGLTNGSVNSTNALKIYTAPDSEAFGILKYSSDLNSGVAYSETEGVVRAATQNDYFTIYNKDGGKGITLTLTDGFMMEFTAAFSKNADILLGKKNGTGGHPFVFRNGAALITIGGSSPQAEVRPTGINMNELATYSYTLCASVFHVKITQGSAVYENDFTFNGTVAENFLTFNYMFPNFSEYYNFKGTVKDLKLWTSYAFDVTANGEATVTADKIALADGETQFTLIPKSGYTIKGVTASSGVLTALGNNTYSLACPTADLTITADTTKIVGFGDANCDGIVDLKDLVRIKRYLLSHTQKIDLIWANIDGSSDGSITAEDLSALINRLLGILQN